MADILFISESDIKTNSSVSNNLDPKLIMPCVDVVQEIYVRSTLGDDLYEAILAEIDAASISAENQTLINKMKKTIVHFAIYEALPFIATRIEQSGVVVMEDETYTGVDLDRLNSMCDVVKNRAELYLFRFKEWLEDNSDDYPLYSKCQDTDTFDFGGFIF